jgi:hypothetical protein
LIHRNPRSYARRSTFEKRENFFQLISTLFCEVKTPEKLKITLSRVEIRLFLQGVLSPKIYAGTEAHS